LGLSGIALCVSSGEAMKRTDAHRKRLAGVASAIENRRIGRDWPYWALYRRSVRPRYGWLRGRADQRLSDVVGSIPFLMGGDSLP
jgi:hypothetical protein